jgi:hypothetical protein
MFCILKKSFEILFILSVSKSKSMEKRVFDEKPKIPKPRKKKR